MPQVPLSDPGPDSEEPDGFPVSADGELDPAG